MMKTKLVTAPAIEPVALSDLEDHMRLTAGTEDSYISNLIKSARRIIELHSGRRFINQTWELTLPDFPHIDRITLPYPPLVSVTSVKYYETDDTENTFSSDDYYVDTYAEPGAVALNYGETWPSTTLRPTNGVIVRYVCGYGTGVEDVPEMYKEAIKLLTAEMYEHREAGIVGRIYTKLPWSVRQILGYERIMHI